MLVTVSGCKIPTLWSPQPTPALFPSVSLLSFLFSCSLSSSKGLFFFFFVLQRNKQPPMLLSQAHQPKKLHQPPPSCHWAPCWKWNHGFSGSLSVFTGSTCPKKLGPCLLCLNSKEEASTLSLEPWPSSLCPDS